MVQMAQLHTQEKTVDYTAAGASRITRKQMRAGCGSAGKRDCTMEKMCTCRRSLMRLFHILPPGGQVLRCWGGSLRAGWKAVQPGRIIRTTAAMQPWLCAAFPGGGMLRCGQKKGRLQIRNEKNRFQVLINMPIVCCACRSGERAWRQGLSVDMYQFPRYRYKEDTAMGRKYQWKTRFGSAILAASMLSTILPFQVIAAAVETEDEKPVSVRWEPQTQTEDGKVNVDLTVELNPQDGSTLTAAMVEISLDSEEADALQWNGTSISVSELGTQEDDENQDSGETTTITPPATEEGKDETDTTQTSESTATPDTDDGTGGATQSDPEEETDETDTTQPPQPPRPAQMAHRRNRHNHPG